MNITKREKEKLTYTIEVSLERAEAKEKSDKSLKEYRRKAEIKGFRKGMAPMSLIEKFYGHAALTDAVDSIVSEGLNNYIREEKLDIIGEPLPDEKQKKIDWDNDSTFEFLFDIAVRPEVNLSLSEKDKVTAYKLKITPEALQKYKEDILRQFGSLEDAPEVGEEDFLVADIEQGEKRVEKSYLTMKTIDPVAKKLFLGKKVGDTLDVDVVKNFPNETDRASMLRIKKEEFDPSNPIYKFTIREVKTFRPAQENQDLYDRFCGKDKVKTSEEFMKELESRLSAEYQGQTDFRLRRDLIDYLVKKAALDLPENFLKRWLLTINEGKYTEEQINNELPLFLQDFKWQLISHKLVEQQKIEIKREDLLAEAKKMAASQFAMYGMVNLPDEQLAGFAESLLKDEKQIGRIYERCEEERVLEYVKGLITITEKEVTPEELAKQNAKEEKGRSTKKQK